MDYDRFRNLPSLRRYLFYFIKVYSFILVYGYIFFVAYGVLLLVAKVAKTTSEFR